MAMDTPWLKTKMTEYGISKRQADGFLKVKDTLGIGAESLMKAEATDPARRNISQTNAIAELELAQPRVMKDLSGLFASVSLDAAAGAQSHSMSVAASGNHLACAPLSSHVRLLSAEGV